MSPHHCEDMMEVEEEEDLKDEGMDALVVVVVMVCCVDLVSVLISERDMPCDIRPNTASIA